MRSRRALWLSILLAPPLGLILLWLRPGLGIGRKLGGSLAISVLGVSYLFLFLGMRLETEGHGFPTIVTFESENDRMRALEEDRARQKELGPPEPTPPVIPAEPVEPIEEKLDPVKVSEPGPSSWPEFRGPGRTGRYEGPIRTDWEGALAPLWREPVGGGYASFAAGEGRAFTIEQRHEEEVVAAYDLSTGRELWTGRWPAYFQETLGGDGPRATPTWDDGFLYALGAEGELRKLAASTGELVWRKNILEEAGAENITWGMAASPLVADGKVIVLPGGRGASIVAYDVQTGEPVWRVLDDKAAYTAPMLVELAGERQLLVVSALRLMGLRLETGELLWDYPWTTQSDINVSQPVVIDEGHVFLSAAYGHGAALVEVSRGEGGFETRTVWENVHMKNKFSSSVLHEGHLYGLDEAILACIDARTGERKWKGGRYGYGQILLASGHLIVLTEGGDLVLVRATPEKLDERARFSAIEGKTWNHPAIVDGILLVRNLREMAAFDLRPVR